MESSEAFAMIYQVKIQLVLQQGPDGQVLSLLDRSQTGVEVGEGSILHELADDQSRVGQQLIGAFKPEVGNFGAWCLSHRPGLYAIRKASQTETLCSVRAGDAIVNLVNSLSRAY